MATKKKATKKQDSKKQKNNKELTKIDVKALEEEISELKENRKKLLTELDGIDKKINEKITKRNNELAKNKPVREVTEYKDGYVTKTCVYADGTKKVEKRELTEEETKQMLDYFRREQALLTRRVNSGFKSPFRIFW